MQHYHSLAESGVRTRPRAKVAKVQPDGMMRGLVNGVILSLVMWIAAGYLTFILR